jgi:serine protease Do
VVLVGASAAACVGQSGSRPGHPVSATLDTNTIERLSRGVFEVVTPRIEDETVTYQTPLPVDLLPYRERQWKVHSIGTAFAIPNGHFITAAHVLSTDQSQHTRYYLRGAAGPMIEIGRIIRYSDYRDVAEFELVSPARNVVPLDLATETRVGDPVFTVGNALGQGVVIRGGTVTSFTLEDQAGRWEYIRFTAPASPGNSGGPLVDASGRVLGVVVRKSPTENLNIALPLAEAAKVGTIQSEFWSKGVQFNADNKQLFEEWRFSSPLPASLPELRDAVRKAYLAFAAKGMADLEAKYAADLFPRHQNLDTYLRSASIPFGLGHFKLDSSGKWKIAHFNYTNRELAPGQWAHFASDHDFAEIIIARPRGTPLQRFYESPRALAETIIRLLDLKRPFAGQQIAFDSFGEPAERERWTDSLGRPWLTYIWRFGFSDESAILDCLTNPAGLACEWYMLATSHEDQYRVNQKWHAPRVTLSYYGRIGDWVEFLALPDAYKPKLLSGGGVGVKLEKGLALDVGGFRGSIDAPFLSEDSTLYAYTAPIAAVTGEPRFLELRVKLRSDKAYEVGVERVFQPAGDSPEFHTKLWSNLQKTEAPYNGVARFDGKNNSVKRVGKPAGALTPGVLDLYYCKSDPEDDRNELEKTCANLMKTLKVFEPAGAPPQ